MAQTYQAKRISEGMHFDHTPSSAVDAGDVVVSGSLAGFAARPIAADALGALENFGIFDVVKANEEISAGTLVYWDADGDPQGGTAGSGAATATSTSNTMLGYALATAGATAEVVRILKLPLAAVSTSVYESFSAVISDPGDTEAIPVTNSGSVSLVTTGAETRTLAAPSFVGQVLSLGFKTDGGDCVVTAAAGINQTGNDTLTFADAGDVITLIAIESGASKVWRVLSNDGVALSTA